MRTRPPPRHPRGGAPSRRGRRAPSTRPGGWADRGARRPPETRVSRRTLQLELALETGDLGRVRRVVGDVRELQRIDPEVVELALAGDELDEGEVLGPD